MCKYSLPENNTTVILKSKKRSNNIYSTLANKITHETVWNTSSSCQKFSVFWGWYIAESKVIVTYLLMKSPYKSIV
jgi:hypothetical protein